MLSLTTWCTENKHEDRNRDFNPSTIARSRSRLLDDRYDSPVHRRENLAKNFLSRLTARIESQPPATHHEVTVKMELSENELPDDDIDKLREQEASLPIYFGNSRQLDVRRHLVNWLLSLCDKFEVCTTTRHLTVTLLDYFMDAYHLEEPRQKLVVLCTLLVAG